MTWADALKILFGTGLGLLISLGQSWLMTRRQRKRAEKLLLIELPTIKKTVQAFTNENIEALADTRLMPITELQHLNYIGGNELASLSDSIAPHVYELDSTLKQAEVWRKLAFGYLNNQSSPEFNIYSTLYVECMHVALKAIVKIQEHLSCQEVASADRSTSKRLPGG